MAKKAPVKLLRPPRPAGGSSGSRRVTKVQAPPRPAREPMNPVAKRRIRAVLLHTSAAVLFAAVLTTGFIASKRHGETVTRLDTPPVVSIVNKPEWMSAALAEQIRASVRPTRTADPDDQSLLKERVRLLTDNPWVRQVNSVRRTFHQRPGDTIEIDCVYRAPVALARFGPNYYYIDSDGVRLPEVLSKKQVDQLLEPGRSPMFRVVEGLAHAPTSAGRVWPGGDLQAGIELIALLAEPVFNDIVSIDVSNYSGRIDPGESQINLITRFGTQIRWGQPPSSKAFFMEQLAGRKLDVLRQARASTGRVDMNLPWIDLRFDNPTVPQASGRMLSGTDQ